MTAGTAATSTGNLQPAVGINIPTLPFNFNCWAFSHTQTLPLIEGFLNTVVTKTSSSHRGIHQLLLMQFHKQSCLPLDRVINHTMLKSIFLLTEGFTIKMCWRAPSSWQRDSPVYAKKHLPLDKGIYHTMLKNIFLLTEGFTMCILKKHLPLDRGIYHDTVLKSTFLINRGITNRHCFTCSFKNKQSLHCCVCIAVHFSKAKYFVFSETITLSQLTNLHCSV